MRNINQDIMIKANKDTKEVVVNNPFSKVQRFIPFVLIEFVTKAKLVIDEPPLKKSCR